MGKVRLRAIPESPNKNYKAGSDGHVYSRTRYAGFGRKVFVEWYALKGHKTPKGYIVVSLCHNNKKVTKAVHRLVCSAFHGRPTPKTLQVRHLNGDPSDNRPTNLRWGSQQENWLDRKAHGRGISGERHPMAMLTDPEREHIRWAIRKGLCSGRHAARMLGLSQACISSLLRSK